MSLQLSLFDDLFGFHVAQDGQRIYGALDGDFIKIGVTTVQNRVAKLQTGNPRQLTLMFDFAGNEEIERLLHVTFATFHVRGEWFRADPSVLFALQMCQALSEARITAKAAQDMALVALRLYLGDH